MASIHQGVPQDAKLIITLAGGFVGEIRSIGIGGETYQKIDITAVEDLIKQFKLGETKEIGDLRLTVLYDPGESVPLGTTETVTVTFQTYTGFTSGASLVFVGGIYQTGDIEFSKDGSGAVEQEWTMFVNSVTPTAAVES